MRLHARESRAALTERQAGSFDRTERGEFADRDASRDANGSSAPAARGKAGVAALAAAVLSALVFLVASAYASNEVVDFFGSSTGSGTLGGQFNTPRDVAVNRTGVGGVPAGTIYVVDSANHRVQRFSASGDFVAAWGANVLTPSVSEQQTLSVAATAGTYTLSFEGATTASIAYNATATVVQTALRALPTVGGNNLTVTGTAPYTIAFNASMLGTNVGQITADTTLLTGTATTATTTEGAGKYEICTVAEQCRAGTATGGANAADNEKNGSLDDPQSVAVDGDTGNVYVSDRDNRRVNEYSATGVFIRSFGVDVDATEAATTYEVCPAADRCKFGLAGAGTGQIGAATIAGSMGIAVSPPDGEAAVGKVFLSDTLNRRVNTYELDGTLPASFGSATKFGANMPRSIAVDSRGIVYASNTENGAEVERYDSENANGAGVGFLAPITATTASPTGPLLPGTTTATSGLAVDPSSDVLYVLRDPSVGNTVVQQFGPTNDPGLTAPPQAVDDTHGSGAGFGVVQGFGLNDLTGTLYVTATTDVSGLGAASRVYVLDTPLTAPVPAMTSVSAITANGAIFSGTVDPKGGYVRDCKFQYSTDQVVWTDIPEPACSSLNPDGGPQAVSEETVNLSPDRHYYVRLQASRTFVANSEVNSAVKVFDTAAVVPAVSKVGAIQVSDTSARLLGTVDPRGSQAGYYFEYGETPALGSRTKAVNLGSGSSPAIVSEVVTGLAPGTTYFFRLVAGNTFGQTPSTVARLVTLTERPVAAKRAYEQVSPVDKNVGDAFGLEQTTEATIAGDVYVSDDGNRVAYTATGGFGENPPENYYQNGIYYAKRTANGWKSDRIIQPACVQTFGLPLLIPASTYVSRDFSHVSFPEPEGEAQCATPPLDPNAPADERSTNLYRHDLNSPPTFDLINPEHNPITQLGYYTFQTPSGAYRGASDDQTHIVFASSAAQTPDAPPPTPLNNEHAERIYEWQQLDTPGCTSASPDYNATVEACLSLVSKDPDGNPITVTSIVPGSALAGAAGNAGNGNNDALNAVSADGSRIFFQAPNTLVSTPCDLIASCELYMREDKTTTYDVSQSECTSACGASAADSFRVATPSGDKVIFSSAAKLTDSDTSTSGQDLYLYVHSADPATDQNLTDISIDAESRDGTAANVQGLVGASDDLETVFFVANGQLVNNAPLGAGPKLYRWTWNSGAPRLEYLATMNAADADQNWSFEQERRMRRERRVTPSGSALILESKAQLDPAADQDSDEDVYRWTEQRGFECASCQLPDVASSGPSNTGGTGRITRAADLTVTNEMSTAITDDGRRIVFQTADALVPEDTNSPCVLDPTLNYYPCTDVYEWNQGLVSLVTPGKEADGSLTDITLTGITPSGNSVLFATRLPLVGWDLDTSKDVYAARIGGGLPEPPTGVLCEGEACRGAGTQPPAVQGAGTAAFSGPGNQVTNAKKNCPKGKRKVRRKGKVQCVKPKKRAHKRRSGQKPKHGRAANQNRRASR